MREMILKEDGFGRVLEGEHGNSHVERNAGSQKISMI